MINNILFRCDVDEKNGFGHFSRCLNISRAIQTIHPEISISFLGQYNDFAVDLLEKYQLLQTDSQSSFIGSIEFQLETAKQYDCLVLDSYFVDQDYIDKFVNQSFKFVKIDDFNELNLEELDLVINFCISAHENSYKGKEICLGVSFFPVRNELKIIRLKNELVLKEEISNVLVFIGGNDRFNLGTEVVRVLDQIFSNLHINLITTQISETKNIKSLNNHISYSPMTIEIEEQLKEADVVITGGGLFKYECAYCCLPNASLSQTIEQYNETKSFAAEGVTYNLGMAKDFDDLKLAKMLREFCSLQTRQKIHKNTKKKFITNSNENLVYPIIS